MFSLYTSNISKPEWAFPLLDNISSILTINCNDKLINSLDRNMLLQLNFQFEPSETEGLSYKRANIFFIESDDESIKENNNLIFKKIISYKTYLEDILEKYLLELIKEKSLWNYGDYLKRFFSEFNEEKNRFISIYSRFRCFIFLFFDLKENDFNKDNLERYLEEILEDEVSQNVEMKEDSLYEYIESFINSCLYILRDMLFYNLGFHAETIQSDPENEISSILFKIYESYLDQANLGLSYLEKKQKDTSDSIFSRLVYSAISNPVFFEYDQEVKGMFSFVYPFFKNPTLENYLLSQENS